ncbi:MAG: hypothetical protein ABSF81_17085 [Bacteroidales bacterium]
MKHIGRFSSNFTLLFMFLLSYGNQTSGQKNVNISAGFGLPELLNIGVRYQLEQVQIGLSVGSIPVKKDESIFSVSGDVFYHFGGYSKLSTRHPWYGRVGLDYLKDETETLLDKYLYLNSRIGRDFNISKKIAIEIEAGAFFRLFYNEIRKNPSNAWEFDFNFPVLPSFGIGLSYCL